MSSQRLLSSDAGRSRSSSADSRNRNNRSHSDHNSVDDDDTITAKEAVLEHYQHQHQRVTNDSNRNSDGEGVENSFRNTGNDSESRGGGDDGGDLKYTPVKITTNGLSDGRGKGDENIEGKYHAVGKEDTTSASASSASSSSSGYAHPIVFHSARESPFGAPQSNVVKRTTSSQEREGAEAHGGWEDEDEKDNGAWRQPPAFSTWPEPRLLDPNLPSLWSLFAGYRDFLFTSVCSFRIYTIEVPQLQEVQGKVEADSPKALLLDPQDQTETGAETNEKNNSSDPLPDPSEDSNNIADFTAALQAVFLPDNSALDYASLAFFLLCVPLTIGIAVLCITLCVQNNLPVYFASHSIAGFSAFSAFGMTLFLVLCHLTTYTNPKQQRLIIRIVLMVPVYAIDSFLALVFYEYATVIVLVRDMYEGYVIYQFYLLMMEYMGGEDRVLTLWREYGTGKNYNANMMHTATSLCPTNPQSSPWRSGGTGAQRGSTVDIAAFSGAAVVTTETSAKQNGSVVVVVSPELEHLTLSEPLLAATEVDVTTHATTRQPRVSPWVVVETVGGSRIHEKLVMVSADPSPDNTSVRPGRGKDENDEDGDGDGDGEAHLSEAHNHKRTTTEETYTSDDSHTTKESVTRTRAKSKRRNSCYHDMPHLFPLNYILPNMRLNRDTLFWWKLFLMQYVILNPLLTLVSIPLYFTGLYHDGSFQFRGEAYPYIAFLRNVSVLLSFTALVYFYFATKRFMAEYSPTSKFVAIKIIIFLSFWQSVVLSALNFYGLIPPHIAKLWTSGDVVTGMQNVLICIEMFFISIAHRWIFTDEIYLSRLVIPFETPLNSEEDDEDEDEDEDKAERKRSSSLPLPRREPTAAQVEAAKKVSKYYSAIPTTRCEGGVNRVSTESREDERDPTITTMSANTGTTAIAATSATQGNNSNSNRRGSGIGAASSTVSGVSRVRHVVRAEYRQGLRWWVIRHAFSVDDVAEEAGSVLFQAPRQSEKAIRRHIRYIKRITRPILPKSKSREGFSSTSASGVSPRGSSRTSVVSVEPTTKETDENDVEKKE